MELAEYFEAVEVPGFEFNDGINHRRLGDLITVYAPETNFPDISDFDIAIVGVGEDRNAPTNQGTAKAPDHIRQYLYQLFQGRFQPKIVDLGNIKTGFTVEDTYFAISSVLSEIMEAGVVPIILGGSQDITYANYLAYESLGQIINMVTVDPKFDLGDVEGQMDNRSFFSKIILHQPNFLFNYTNLGYQTYFVDQDAVRLMKNLLFDAYRLGVIRENLEEIEPLVRNADMISFDMSAIRFSDAPANRNVTPNGLYGEEACQITRYAGMSDKLSSIGFYEVNPEVNDNGQTAHLTAQMIWYFIDGFYNRKQDLPPKGKSHNENDFIKYMVPIEEQDQELVFLKSKKSDRWWMRVPCSAGTPAYYDRHYMVPCSYNDYETALKNEVPDLWWQFYQKLM